MSPPRPPLTSSQTVGPFFHDCLLRPDARRPVVASEDEAGERIGIRGLVLDGEGRGVPDAMIELWQADADGRYRRGPAPAGSGFLGFGRTGTDEQGAYWFATIRPGPVRFDDNRLQARHLSLAIFGRGLLNHLFTRLYFSDDPATATDPILSMVAADRRDTLVALRDDTPDGVSYRFDIVLQGPRETVFFDFGAARR